MQITSESRFISGTFKRELKNRFLYEVQINNEDVICYVPSSCHLSNFLHLEGKRVLLTPTQTPKALTSYALFAVPHKRNYIVLNTSMANRVVEASIQSRRFSSLGKRSVVRKELLVDGYKADLYLPDSNTIVEIKSVISLEPTAISPTVFSERSIKQLQALRELLKTGHKVFFAIISLNPYVKEIHLDTKMQLYKELSLCVEDGLLLRALTCKFKNNTLLIDKQIPIIADEG